MAEQRHRTASAGTPLVDGAASAGDLGTQPGTSRVRVRYETTTALYASQVVVNASTEEVVVGFASGYVPDPASGEPLLPVHTRIAMSPAAARRLVETLQRSLDSAREDNRRRTEAGLPKL
ncbi:MAG: DUF3467 domain-containing protein [Ectothiorhodospiraceae bacterium]|nr:DUF3467 domain-containing protein [Chromatiales bacterium]MCP5154225.1 DUF3467 domain-containing protein [Ectothiorhodospiraceae bacterium]